MSSTLPSVINMVNTAFGVTVLAVPYCFHQCGIILGCTLLAIASYASKRSCCLLLRSAQTSRKRDFESLGLHVEGFLGKFIIEMSLIGYLVGTCIAWFVVIGDVAPAVLSSLFGIEKSWNLRMALIIIIGLGGVLPLSLIKDIKSLSSASNVAIGIYSLFVIQLFVSTLPTILSGEWIDVVNFWKPSGMLQCLPIFVISFLCQTVLFVIYDVLQEPTVKKMENVVNTAMDILLFLSTTVGFCGYVMFCNDGIQGDLLNNYQHDFISEFIRLGFCISTVLSFPLLIFPCRVSINSMISSAKSSVEGSPSVGGTFIPDDRFFVITCSLVVGTILFGILFPNVEFVMALVGATMGSLLTYILPSYIYLKIAEKETTSNVEAKVLIVVGLCLFCMSTFTVLSMSESHENVVHISQVRPIDSQPTISRNSSILKKETKVEEDLELKLGGFLGTKTKEARERRKTKRDELNLQDPVKTLNNNGVILATAISRRELVIPQERVLMGNSAAKSVAILPVDEPKLDTNDRITLDEQEKELHAVHKRSAEDRIEDKNAGDVIMVKPNVSNTSLSLVVEKMQLMEEDKSIIRNVRSEIVGNPGGDSDGTGGTTSTTGAVSKSANGSKSLDTQKTRIHL